MVDGMMCVTYLIKEDLMSTSNSPGVRRATAEIHANEPGFMASLVRSRMSSKMAESEGAHQLSRFHRRNPSGWGVGGKHRVGHRSHRLCVWAEKQV